MHKMKDVVTMLEEALYKEFTETPWENIDIKEVGEVADILKDFTEAMVNYQKIKMPAEKPSEEAEMTTDDIVAKLNSHIKGNEMSGMDKNILRSKLQNIIQSL